MVQAYLHHLEGEEVELEKVEEVDWETGEEEVD